jgi:hypothetical protein
MTIDLMMSLMTSVVIEAKMDPIGITLCGRCHVRLEQDGRLSNDDAMQSVGRQDLRCEVSNI